MTPPHTRRDAVVDTLHGTQVPDPYRWLERGDDPEVQRWVAEQNRLTRSALDAIPERGAWHERLVALMALPVVEQVLIRGDRLFLLERDAGAQQSRLVVRSLTDPAGDVRVLVDPLDDADDDASAIDWFKPSADGELVVFGVSDGGSENSTMSVARVVDGSLLADRVPNCRAASIAWESDGSGLYYTRYPEGDEYHRTVHHHVLGADWRDDPVVWVDTAPATWPTVDLSSDGRFLLVQAMKGWQQVDLHVLDRTTGAWRVAVEGRDVGIEDWSFVSHDRVIGTTTLDAPRGRVVEIDLASDDIGPSTWRTVVPERDAVLGRVTVTLGGMYLPSTSMAVDRLEFVAHDGSITPVGGTGVCTIASVSADPATGAAVCIVSGFDRPPSMWSILPGDTGPVAVPQHPVVDRAVVADLDVTQVEYPSQDGTLIPMFLVHRSGALPSPSMPAILSGYGGFAMVETPEWSPMAAAWCASGGLFAAAGLRGGLEHGAPWHDAGRRGNKQNVFDDFAAAADWLAANGRTSPDRLAIRGRSNGGLLVGATITQRPDVCRAAWCGVPLLDMIRFPEFLIARLWTDEYGDPDIAEQFEWLWAYSPYHHVREGERYPAVLFTTAEGDARVDPLHARKMAALMQWAAVEQDDRPILLMQEGRAGHGSGKPVAKRADEQADVLAFYGWQLGHHP